VEEDEAKNLSKRFFVNENSTAICMTIVDTAAWPTSMELWDHPTNSKTDPFQTNAQRVLTNQPTTKELRVGTCSLRKSLPTSCGLISHSCVWPQCWAQKQTPVTVTEECAYTSEFPDVAEDLDIPKLQTTAQTAIGLYEWGAYLWVEGFLRFESRVIRS
jgi:hypothetical protein